jgi:hypothetical protein
MRFWNSTPLIFSGLNNFGIGFSSGCGSNAVPDGGIWAGVKYGRLGAGAFARTAMVGRGVSDVDGVLYDGRDFERT